MERPAEIGVLRATWLLDARCDVALLATIEKTGEVGEVQVVSGPMRFRDAAIDGEAGDISRIRWRASRWMCTRRLH